ncbi:TetR family transcriptional regulator [Nocardia sp. NPDC052001]|uniref:TetR/AcrR family transcriptional regulator n=1 Tax=Nocardia sp. NPDC052001 TaxID=3154853 RepID=UPI003434839B
MTATSRPRRSPDPQDRRRDAERSRQALLNAALDEFSEKGYDGARIQDIAARAGVNKQLIAYYFGGKENLYREIQRDWQQRETAITDPALPLQQVADRYLAAGFAEPRAARLMAWHGLTAGDPELTIDSADTDLANLRRARDRGEFPAELDPEFLRTALLAIVSAPVIYPQVAQGPDGIRPGSAEFETWYRDQLRKLLSHLAAD